MSGHTRRLGCGAPPGAAAFAFVAAVALTAGCDFFSTRDPQEGEGEESLWQPPVSPQLIVTNLEVAFENAIFNDYLRALTTDFVFRPDLSDSVQIEIEFPGLGVFTDWTREVEESVASTIAAGADSIALDFQVGTEELLGNDRLLKKRYVLTLIRATDTSTFEGEAWFYTRQLAGGEWYIYRWEDVRAVASATSWGLLKGRNRLL